MCWSWTTTASRRPSEPLSLRPGGLGGVSRSARARPLARTRVPPPAVGGIGAALPASLVCASRSRSGPRACDAGRRGARHPPTAPALVLHRRRREDGLGA
ncbi:MAG: hypothetical protein MZV64_14020 [Ignavibacteriales bacterium]|nr:hypothetical protein [Ignavibacteriales bacterium]